MSNEFFIQLHNEHQKIQQTLSKINEGSLESRNQLFNELKINLLPHMEAEEKAFYPVLVNNEDVHQSALEAIEEHHISKILFSEIQNSDPNSDVWLAKCKVLKDLLDHHIEEEEEEIFELTKESIPEQKINQIYNNYLIQKDDFRGRLAA